ncbi:MAG: DUF1573 domain-containing protein [Chitinophagaceae bacterium]|nr:DUF1573 domain-containing protein [Chitinophagaceae bacterium]
MKKYMLLLLAPVLIVSCDNSRKDKTNKDKENQAVLAAKDSTTVQIIDSAYDYGKVTDGEKVAYNYRFKNSGNKPLVIISASSTCGCTIPEKPEKPVMPGEIGFIKVVFNSKGKVGSTHKLITVESNANPPFPELLLTGTVEEEKK